jgi:hypothetical protein
MQNTYTALSGYSDNNKEIGFWLKNNTTKRDYVYINGAGSSPILSYSDRISPSKYITAPFITSAFERNIVLSDLKAKPPLYYIRRDASYTNMGENFDRFIQNNYTYLLSKYGYEILKKNSK